MIRDADRLGFIADIQMVKKLIFSLLLLSASELCFASAASSPSPLVIPADQIKEGCTVEFISERPTNETNAPGSQPHEIAVKWICKGVATATIDRYQVEGGSPQIITTLFLKRKIFVALAKWPVTSHASDFQGDFYKVYIYKYNRESNTHPFIRDDKMMDKFGLGWDGVKDGITVTYPFKDAALIRSRLNQLKIINMNRTRS
ncbi:hypothetical protein ACAX43_21440 [Paraburkholderia sp. IW21]|uniref:hypothetical protein n=1 Tax=Paraburkholderia sp. IW21 TaxID=3242488 RepID=UPI003521ADD1